MDDAEINGLIIILGAFLSAVIGGFIGSQRNRVGAGIFWSIFLGPIGWLIVLLGPDYRLKCPECKGVIESGVKRCKHCGMDFMKRQRPVVQQDFSDPIPDDYRPTNAKMYVPLPEINRTSPKAGDVIQIMIIGLALLISMPSSVYSADHQFVVTVRGQPQQAKKKITYKSGSGFMTDRDIAKTLVLEIEIKNVSAKLDTCMLEWFFISKALTSDDRRVFDQGTQTNAIKSMESVKVRVQSQPLVTSETAWGDGDVWKRGEKIEGYVVLIKDEAMKLISLKSASTQLDTIAKDPEKWAELLKTAVDVPNAEK